MYLVKHSINSSVDNMNHIRLKDIVTMDVNKLLRYVRLYDLILNDTMRYLK